MPPPRALSGTLPLFFSRLQATFAGHSTASRRAARANAPGETRGSAQQRLASKALPCRAGANHGSPALLEARRRHAARTEPGSRRARRGLTHPAQALPSPDLPSGSLPAYGRDGIFYRHLPLHCNSSAARPAGLRTRLPILKIDHRSSLGAGRRIRVVLMVAGLHPDNSETASHEIASLSSAC